MTADRRIEARPRRRPGARPRACSSACPRWPATPALRARSPAALAGRLSPSPDVAAARRPTASTAPCPNPTPAPTPTPGADAASGAAAAADAQCPLPTQRARTSARRCPGADPISTIAWVFTPLFQAIFIGSWLAYDAVGVLISARQRLVGDIGIAIIVLTLVIRLLLVPLFRRADRVAAADADAPARDQGAPGQVQGQSRQDRGGADEALQGARRRARRRAACRRAPDALPAGPMYQVFTPACTAPDITSMLTVFGVQVIDVTCQPAAATGCAPCINPNVPWLLAVLSTDPAPGLQREPARDPLHARPCSASASACWRSSRPCCSSSRRA